MSGADGGSAMMACRGERESARLGGELDLHTMIFPSASPVIATAERSAEWLERRATGECGGDASGSDAD